MQRNQSSSFYLGVDGGGSKCKAVVVNHDLEILGSAVAGPANPCVDYQLAIHSITESCSQALAEAGLSQQQHQIELGLALAGVNFENVFQRVNEWSHPYHSMRLITDWHAACLGAHEGKDGAVVIVGTGSCGYVCVDGHSKSFGGHGFPVGDKGSGAWLGLQAVKAALLAKDEMGPATLLMDKLCESLSCKPEELAIRMVGASSAHYAQLAKTVFAANKDGDEQAARILREATDYIEAMLASILKYQPPRLSFVGGITPFLVPLLNSELRERISRPLANPEMGAVYALLKNNR
ncbi:BadF/BadG/BcrA/BcrD ATPase family protein [Pseudoteredinibacter isoporae]|uniref:Glucosamine kinase n=1 Tax=Pseudoteredinibacter isoporae TaxID=570281 RepID=A0A7X0JPQ9_9GAMM|nr:glucosamine kinase [Pseudoteredinibacter isoporae]NHO85601.1 ATPase [Pseudoteredinibacter isoporae]NIB25947.1 ATPase [Pseudoteredinibacter isoporae]